MTARDRVTGLPDEAASDLSRQLAVHRELRWDTMELRSVGGQAVGALGTDELDRLAGRLQDAGVTVPAIASRIGNWASDIDNAFEPDLHEFERLAAFGARVGTRMIRVMSYGNVAATDDAWRDEVVRRLRLLAARASAAGLKIVHENCAGWGGRSVAHMIALAEAIQGPGFGVLFDIGNGPSHGYDSLEMLRAVLPHVAHVHVKDARLSDDGQASFTMPGEGDCEVAACIDLLERSGYGGLYAIEPHLRLIPHLGISNLDGSNGDSAAEAYIRYGRTVQAMVDAAVAGRTRGTQAEESRCAV